jgi:CubicO group peptidase (beta-lactamase class C family)
MKSIGLLVCLCLIVLAVSANPLQEGTGMTGNVSSAILPMQVSGNSTTPQNGPSDPAEVGAFLDQVMPAALAQYNVPGATVAVVKDGRLVVAKGYGYSDIANKTPVNATTTTFRIGSITKLFTWTAVMQLAEEGKINLDADVNTYLSDFKIPDTYPGQPVTMRHLLTHTAGFEDTGIHAQGEDPKNLISFRQYCKENIPARVRPPGKVTSYSNYGTTLAAVIVEDVSGMPFEQYLQSRILTPLAMGNTSIREDLPPDMALRLTKGYTFTNGENVPEKDTIYVIGPAGTIGSTSPDMAKFMIAHLQNGTYGNAMILAPKTADLMHARAFANDPRVTGMALGFYEQYYNGRRAIAHGGDTELFHSLLVLLPDEQAGFFVSSNSAGGRGVRDTLFTSFMDHYYPGVPQVLPRPDPSASARLQQYAGTYEMNRHTYTRFEKYLAPSTPIEVTASPEGTVVITTAASPVTYVEVQPGVFSPADGTRPARGDVVFHTAPDGTVDYLCYGNIPVFVYDRVPWYATTGFQSGLRTAAGFILATVLLWPLLFLFRRTHAVPEPSVPRAAVIARWTTGLAALVLLAFVFVLVPWVTTNENLLSVYMDTQTVPPILTAVLTLAVIAGILTLAAIAFTVIAWKAKYWTAPHRVHYTVVVVALIAMLWWVNANCLWVFCL